MITSKEDILSQGQRWAKAAGATVKSEGLEAGEGLEKYKGQEISAAAI
ncbi:nucleotide-diphospho-sugar transferase [Apiospora arundinis]